MRASLLCSFVLVGSLSAQGGAKLSAACRAPADCAAKCQAGAPAACVSAAELTLKQKGAARDLPLAVGALESGCELGELRACHQLARLTGRGVAGTVDAPRATALLQKACDGGHELSCAELGLRFALARGAGANPALASVLLARGQKAAAAACKKGDGQACLTVALAQREGLLPGGAKAFEPGLRRALTLLRARCAAEEPLTCGLAGELLQSGAGAPADAAGARPLLQHACEEQDAPACRLLAEAHEEGLGGKVDVARASALDEQACQRGLTESCVALAGRLRRGVGVKQDEARAASLLSKAVPALTAACERGEGEGCFTLGELARGGGVPELEAKGPAAARSFYERAAPFLRLRCEKGEARACAKVAQDLLEGLSATANLSAGLKLLRRACDVGDALGCYALAERYATGDGRDTDTRRALALHRHACELGHVGACAQEKVLAGRPAVTASAVAARCPNGQLADDDSPSRCCWPGQVWSSKDARCVGPPACPADKVLEGERCVCGGGRAATQDGFCCWAGQTWSAAASTCVGTATSCPPSHLPRNGTCEPLPVCRGALVASQASEGHCCFPGQQWRQERCSGRPTSCGPQWVASGETCVPGIDLAWQYLAAAVGQAAYAMVPVESTLSHRASVVRVISGAGCALRLFEETTDDAPRFKGGHARVVRETSINLAKVTAVGVNENADGYARAGTEYFLSVTGPDIVIRTSTFRDVWEATEERYVPAQESKDEGGVETWGRFVSLPGGAAEAARGIAAAARACGANPEVSTGPGGDLAAERGEISRRLTAQANARAEGARQLAQEEPGAASRAQPSGGSVVADAIVSGLAQGQAQLTQYQEILRAATAGQGTVPPPSATLPAAATGGSAAPAAPAVAVLPAACGTCASVRCAVSFAACGAGSAGACGEAAACVCACQLEQGGCGGSLEALRRCASARPAGSLDALTAPVKGATAQEQPCLAPAGKACWYAPAGEACPSYPTQKACSRKHRACTERTGRAAPGC